MSARFAGDRASDPWQTPDPPTGRAEPVPTDPVRRLPLAGRHRTLTLGGVTCLLLALPMLLIGQRAPLKPVLLAFVVPSGLRACFIGELGIVFDEEMLRNLVETVVDGNSREELELVSPSMFHAGQGAAPLRVGRTTGTACTVDRSFEETFRACYGMESVHARCPRCGVRRAFDRSGRVNAVPKRSP